MLRATLCHRSQDRCSANSQGQICSQGIQAYATSKQLSSVGVFAKGDHLLFVRYAAPYKGTRVFLPILRLKQIVTKEWSILILLESIKVNIQIFKFIAILSHRYTDSYLFNGYLLMQIIKKLLQN